MNLDGDGTVVIDGVRYSREDADALGLTKKAKSKVADKPANKARTPSNKKKD